MLTRIEQKIKDEKVYIDEKLKNQQSPFLSITKSICSTVFESFEEIIREQMEKKNERISKLEAGKCLLHEPVMSLKHAKLPIQKSKDELEQ